MIIETDYYDYFTTLTTFKLTFFVNVLRAKQTNQSPEIVFSTAWKNYIS